jgi:hypothetical protein
VFAFPIASPALIAKIEGRFIVSEENGSQAAAEWIALERLRAGEFALFPPGLLAHLGQ